LLTDPGPPSHLAREEAALIRLLEFEAVDYTIISDRDFAYRLPLDSVQLIIFNTHSEYWSEEMLGRLSEAIDRGISIAFLSGNNMYRKVQFLDSAISVIDQMIPADQIVPLIGSYYDASGYLTHDSYRVLDPAHWCFEGAGVELNSQFGAAGPNHPAASGYETDKLRSGPHQFRVVAVGKNAEGPAFMLCRNLPNGGFVFTAGSVAFAPCLDTDPVARKLVRNLIDRALSSQRAQQKPLAQGANASISAR
jgi:N,N-dimethylformamidase